MVCVARQQVKLLKRRVALDLLASNDGPGFFMLATCVQQLELGVGNAAIVGVHFPRFGAVALADDLDQTRASIDLFAQPLAQLAVAGGKVVLRNRIKTQRVHGGGHAPANRRNSLDTAERKRRGRFMPAPLRHLCGRAHRQGGA